MEDLIVRDYTRTEGYLILHVVDRSIPNDFEHGEPYDKTFPIQDEEFEMMSRDEQLIFLTDKINTEL